MAAQSLRRSISTLISLVIALAVCLMLAATTLLASPAQALANEPALTVGTQATKSKTIKTTYSFVWVKAGKKVYSWSGYNESIKNGTLTPHEGMTSYIIPFYPSNDDDYSVSNLKSSNKNVLKPIFVKKYSYLKYSTKKFGSAKITYTLKYTTSDGVAVTEKVTEKHKVIKYKNPLNTFKVGTKSYVGKFKNTPQVNAKSALKGKLSVKAASGWKIVKIRQVNSKVASGEFVPQKKLKNGSKINIKKSGGSSIEVICYNKSGKYYSSVILAPNFTYKPIAG